MTIQEELYKLIKAMDSAEAVRANVPRIIARWTPEVVVDLTAREALEGIYATQHLDGIKYAMQKELRTVALLLAKRWTEVAEWTTDTFWKNLADINEHFPDAKTDFNAMMAEQMLDFVVANQPTIEADYFNDPLYQHKIESWHTVKTDYSNYYREMTNILKAREQECPWSDDFIRSLYTGEKRIQDKLVWIEFEHLPDALKCEFAQEGLNSQILEMGKVTEAWIESKSINDEQKLRLMVTAVANGYGQVAEMLKQTAPETLKHIRIGQELDLAVPDIIASALNTKHLSPSKGCLSADISFE